MSAPRKIQRERRLKAHGMPLLLAGLLLGGCAVERLPATGPAEFTAETIHLAHEVRFSEDSPTLSSVDRERLILFLAKADPHGDGDVEITIMPGQDERLMHLRAVLAAEGRKPSATFDPHRRPNVAVLSIKQDLQHPTRCAGPELWDSDLAIDTEGLPIGCTTSMNLRAMMDDPGDLAHGRQPGPAAAAPAADLARDYLSRFAAPSAGIPDNGQTGQDPSAVDLPGSAASSKAPSSPAQGQ